MKTFLSEKDEISILNDFDKVVKRWAKKTGKSNDQIRNTVAFLWNDARGRAEEAYQNWLSSNEIGHYGGR